MIKLWYLYLIFVGATDFARQDERISNASRLRENMAPEEVLQIMGEPSHRNEADGFIELALMKFRPKHWRWSETVDIHNLVRPGLPFPNPLPFQIRLFSGVESDVEVWWSATDQIMEMRVPNPRPAPREFHDLLTGQRAMAEMLRALRLFLRTGG